MDNHEDFNTPSLEDSRKLVEETKKGLEQDLKNDNFNKEVESANSIFDECFESACAIGETDVPKHFTEAAVELNLDNQNVNKEIEETITKCSELEARIRLLQLQKQEKQLEKEIADMSKSLPKLRESFRKQKETIKDGLSKVVDGAKAFQSKICNIPKEAWTNTKDAIRENLAKADVSLQSTMAHYHEQQVAHKKESLKIHTDVLQDIQSAKNKKIEKLEHRQESRMHLINAFRALQRKPLITKEDILNSKSFNKKREDILLNTRVISQKYHSGRAGKLEERIAMEKMKAGLCRSRIDNISLDVKFTDRSPFKTVSERAVEKVQNVAKDTVKESNNKALKMDDYER